jgi:hypothetical protein
VVSVDDVGRGMVATPDVGIAVAGGAGVCICGAGGVSGSTSGGFGLPPISLLISARAAVLSGGRADGTDVKDAGSG